MPAKALNALLDDIKSLTIFNKLACANVITRIVAQRANRTLQLMRCAVTVLIGQFAL